MKTFILACSIICMGLLMQSCKESTLYPNDPLKNPASRNYNGLTLGSLLHREWRLHSFEVVGGNITPILNGRLYTIIFDSTLVFTGRADCNTIQGDYASGSNNSLTISNLGSTKMYCGAESRDLDYMAGLRGAVSYSATAAWLRIFYDNGTKVLNFIPIVSEERTGEGAIDDVLGMEWILDTMLTVHGNAPSTITPVPTGQQFTLRFVNQSSIEGNANCNRFSASYTWDFSSLRITPPTHTDNNCGIANSIESMVYDALGNAHSYRLQVGTYPQFTIYFGEGDSFLHFIRKPRDPWNLSGKRLEELAGLLFRLSEYGPAQGQRTVVKTYGRPQPLISVVDGRWIAGTGFCGLFRADYTTSGDALTLTDWSGEPGTDCNGYDRMLYDALRSATGYKLIGEDLQIFYDGGTSVLIYRPVY